jgi:hypothetical protein
MTSWMPTSRQKWIVPPKKNLPDGPIRKLSRQTAERETVIKDFLCAMLVKLFA